MAQLATITSQEQYNQYKERRKTFVSSFDFGGYKVYNELTRLIIEWDIKQDATIIRQKGKPRLPIEVVIEKPMVVENDKRIIRKHRKTK